MELSDSKIKKFLMFLEMEPCKKNLQNKSPGKILLCLRKQKP